MTGYTRRLLSDRNEKRFPTFIDRSAETLAFMIVSAGKIGMQLKVAPRDLAEASGAVFTDIV